jgi:uncharacterized damage-inducible protein DinB
MKTLADRFRHWYDHERDCNAKVLQMLRSVPEEKRGDPQFLKACEKAAHVMLAREVWLERLRNPDAVPTNWQTPRLSVDELAARFAGVEQAWSVYLAGLDDAGLAREFEFKRLTGDRLRWNVEGLLTQVNGHAWYHRGQIASLVAALGGKAVDTDYIFWARPTPVTSP